MSDNEIDSIDDWLCGGGCGRSWGSDPNAEATWAFALAPDADSISVYCPTCGVTPLTPKGKLRLAVDKKNRKYGQGRHQRGRHGNRGG